MSFKLPTESVFDDILLKSIDWLGNFTWDTTNAVQNQQDKYKVVLNVKDFAPEEIKIKTKNGQLIIEAKHDEKKDNYGLISRHFVRKYNLPEDCLLAEIQSRLSADGVLSVTVPRNLLVNEDIIISVSNEDMKYSSKL